MQSNDQSADQIHTLTIGNIIWLSQYRNYLN
jgi:hypothetical protein